MPQPAATMPQNTLTPAQKMEMVQAELEIAKLRLRQQTRARQGLERVAPSRAAVLQRLAPKVCLEAIDSLGCGLTLASHRSSDKPLDLRKYEHPAKHLIWIFPTWTTAESLGT